MERENLFRPLVPKSLLFLGALITLVSLGGCCIQVAEQEVKIRYNPGDDSLEFLIIYKGVSANEGDGGGLPEALEKAHRFLEGRRTFMVEAWGIHDLDLDRISEDLDKIEKGEKESELDQESRERLASILEGITLEEVGIFLDEQRRLSGYQVFHVADLTAALDFLNQQFSRSLLQSMDKGTFVEETPLFDERTRELWRQRAESNLPWLYVVEEHLELDLPMTWESANRVQRALIDDTVSTDNQRVASVLGQFLVHLRYFEVAEERLVMSFGAPVTGVFEFAFPDKDAKCSSNLLDALVEEGVTIDDTIKIEDVRAKLGPATE